MMVRVVLWTVYMVIQVMTTCRECFYVSIYDIMIDEGVRDLWRHGIKLSCMRDCYARK